LIKVELVGVEKLVRALEKFGEDAEQAVVAALLAGGWVVANAARNAAPYLTGNLARSIHPEPVVPGHANLRIVEAGVDAATTDTTGLTVHEAPGEIAVIVGTNVIYAARQEFLHDHPYLRPALYGNEAKVNDEVALAIRRLTEATHG